MAEKLCGAAAEEGRILRDVADLCRRVDESGRSMGVALTSCITPAAGHSTFGLGDDEMEVGIGIHGEPGRERMTLAPAREIVAMLAEAIVEDLPSQAGDGVLAFVNGSNGGVKIWHQRPRFGSRCPVYHLRRPVTAAGAAWARRRRLSPSRSRSPTSPSSSCCQRFSPDQRL